MSGELRPRNIRIGSWCHVCMYQVVEPEERLEKVRAVARELGGVCLSKEYTTVRSRMLFRCALGHEFSTQVNRVLTQHRRCPICARGPRVDLTKLAQTRGGRCLSTEYETTADHLVWECNEGHQWRAALARVKRGSCGAVGAAFYFHHGHLPIRHSGLLRGAWSAATKATVSQLGSAVPEPTRPQLAGGPLRLKIEWSLEPEKLTPNPAQVVPCP